MSLRPLGPVQFLASFAMKKRAPDVDFEAQSIVQRWFIVHCKKFLAATQKLC